MSTEPEDDQKNGEPGTGPSRSSGGSAGFVPDDGADDGSVGGERQSSGGTGG